MPAQLPRVISGTTRVAAVIGWPARHSLSPTIHNAAFAHRRLDWVFVALEVRPGAGTDAVAAMRTLGMGGMSVTMPHKAAVSAAVDDRTPVAAALDAVNCVYWDGDRLVGDNTDAAGFLDALRLDAQVDPAGLGCVVVGAGGAGRAVAWALGQAGAARVTIVNRSPQPAARAATLAGPRGQVGTADAVAGADLVVNATPLGMGPGAAVPELPLPRDVVEALRADQLVVDLIYDPAPTSFLVAAGATGARTLDGRGMLVHQAAHAFRRWTGSEPPVDVMVDAVTTELVRRAGEAATESDGSGSGRDGRATRR